MKKVFRILAVTAVMLSLFVVGVSAAEQPCSGTHGDGWTAISGAQQILESGNYYLNADIEKTITVTTSSNAKSTCVLDIRANDVTLCLGGHSIKPTKSSIGIRVHDKVTGFKLCNCVQASTDTNGNPTSGLVIGNRNRSLIMLSGSAAEMYDNVHLNNCSDEARQNSIVQTNGATFTMYGGTVNNNHFSTNGANAGYVAAVLHALSKSVVNLQGGEISGNTITAAEGSACLAPVVISSTTLTIGGSFVMDGNVVVDDWNYCGLDRASGILTKGETSTVTMSGGTISNNKGGYSGGVCLGGGSFTMSGGTISGNEGGQYGGGVDLLGGTMTMSGGTISNNKLTDRKPYGTQVAVRYYATKDSTEVTALKMTGGIVYADREASSNDLTVLRGAASISGGTVTGNVGTVGAGGKAILSIQGGTVNGNLSKDEIVHPGVGSHAACTITVTGGRFSDDTQLSKLESWISGVTLTPMTIDGKVFYRTGTLGTASCGCSGGKAISGAQTISADGTYYLSGEITGQIEVAAENVTLCLHGRNITNSGTAPAILCSGGNLNIVNGSEAGGTIKSTGAAAASVQVTGSGSVTIGDNVHIDGAASLTTAPVVVEAGSSFTMNGGSISGNKFTASAGYAGGAILSEGAVTLNCGVISGNNLTASTYGSGAVTMNGGTLTMGEHVVITGNTTNKNGGGVALYSVSVFDMTGGIISGNTAYNGGGVAVVNGDTEFTMNGGVISGNTAQNSGGGIDVADGTLILDGTAKITTNKNISSQYGSGVCLRKGAMTMDGGEISENAMKSASPFGTQVTCGLWGGGANVFTMNGGTIKATADGLHNQSDEANGFNAVTVCHGTMTMNGGTIVGDLATVGVMLPAKLKITGGAVYGLVSEGSVSLPAGYTNDGRTRMDCTNSISGGKFSDATELLSEDGLSGLKAWLDDSGTILSVVAISEDELAYEVVNGFYSDSEYMDFQSALDMSLYLHADAGFDPNLFVMDAYEATVSGGYTPELKTQSDIGCLIFTAKGIAAKEMRDDITFTLKNKETGAVMFTKTLSVYDAAARWYEKYEDEQTMWADMIHYGTQAQKRFSYNTRALVEKPDLIGVSNTVDSTGWATEGVIVTEGQGSKVSVSLSLKEQIELNFYIRDSKAKVTDVMFDGVAIDQTEYTVTNSTGTNNAYTVVSFCEIPVKFAKEKASFAVELSNGTKFTVSGSIVDYVELAADNSTEKKLIDALQKYVDSVIALLPDGSMDTGAEAAYVCVESDVEQ